MALPLARSSTKNLPLRDACARSFRGCPSITPSKRTGVWVASQSCVSCGDDWKYHDHLPGVRIQRHDRRGVQVRAFAIGVGDDRLRVARS